MSIDGSAQDPILLEEPSSSKKMIWTKRMERVFLDFLIDQVHLGRKCEGGFKKEAWAAIERQFNVELTMNLSKDQFKNKLKTWKQGFKLVRDLKSKSGFGWNEATQTVEAADSVWDKLFEVNLSFHDFYIRFLNYANLVFVVHVVLIVQCTFFGVCVVSRVQIS